MLDSFTDFAKNHPIAVFIGLLASILTIGSILFAVATHVIEPSFIEIPCVYCTETGRIESQGQFVPCPVCQGLAVVETNRSSQPPCAFCEGQGKAKGQVAPCSVCGGIGRQPFR